MPSLHKAMGADVGPRTGESRRSYLALRSGSATWGQTLARPAGVAPSSVAAGLGVSVLGAHAIVKRGADFTEAP